MVTMASKMTIARTTPPILFITLAKDNKSTAKFNPIILFFLSYFSAFVFRYTFSVFRTYSSATARARASVSHKAA